MTEGKRFAPRVLAITFPAASRWADLEAKILDAPGDKLISLLAVAELAGEVADGVAKVTAAHRVAVEVMTREFAPLIVSWNVDDADGEPVSPDEAGLRGQPLAVAVALYRAWRDGRSAQPEPPQDPDEVLSGIPMTPVPAGPPA